jgi:hypothetical protein
LMVAKIVEKVEREGRIIAIYDNGMERDVERNAIIRPPTAALITKQTTQDMHRKRQEKASRLLRERIRAATEKISDQKIPNSAAAVAEAGGILWDEIVLNTEAYPRDRLEAWLKIGQMAGVISNAKEREEPGKTDPAGTIGALADLVRELRQAVQLRDGSAGDLIHITADDNDTRNE